MILAKADPRAQAFASEALRGGQICVLPTDTIYGFSGIVPESEEKIRRIKNREAHKPLIRLISRPRDVLEYTTIHIPSSLLAFWPGPLTLVIPLRTVQGGFKTAAFRCPGDEWLRSLIASCGSPLYSTSVNYAGDPPLDTAEKIDALFGSDVACVIDGGMREGSLPSTIIEVSKCGCRLLRQGSLVVPGLSCSGEPS